MKGICAVAIAAVTNGIQMETNKFLQAEVPQKAYTPFGQQNCQYIYDYSWYYYENPTPTVAYSDLSADKSQTAYWNLCQTLDITTNIPPACDGEYNAVVLDQSDPLNAYCALNAINYSIETKNVDDSSVITMVYTNTDTTTNNGVEGLDVGLYCDENSVNTTYGTLSPNTQKSYYYTSMTNS